MVGTGRIRFTHRAWLDLALTVLARDGPDGLSVDKLCAAAQRTKGSFYHHFPVHQVFLDELLALWQERHLLAPIRGSKEGGAQARIAALTQLASAIDPQVEIGFRRLASRYENIRRGVAAVDEARIAYLLDLYQAGGMRKADAEQAARIQYAGFVGSLVLWPDSFGTNVRDLGSLVHQMLMAHFK